MELELKIALERSRGMVGKYFDNFVCQILMQVREMSNAKEELDSYIKDQLDEMMKTVTSIDKSMNDMTEEVKQQFELFNVTLNFIKNAFEKGR